MPVVPVWSRTVKANKGDCRRTEDGLKANANICNLYMELYEQTLG